MEPMISKVDTETRNHLGPETMNIFLHVSLTVTLMQKSPRKTTVPERGEVKGIDSFLVIETFALRK